MVFSKNPVSQENLEIFIKNVICIQKSLNSLNGLVL